MLAPAKNPTAAPPAIASPCQLLIAGRAIERMDCTTIATTAAPRPRNALATTGNPSKRKYAAERASMSRNDGATYAASASAVPTPRCRRQPRWAAVSTATGPGSICANASDSANSPSETHPLSRTTTSRICATIAGPPYAVAPMRKNVLAICVLLTPTLASVPEDRASLLHAPATVKAGRPGVGRWRAAQGLFSEEWAQRIVSKGN